MYDLTPDKSKIINDLIVQQDEFAYKKHPQQGSSKDDETKTPRKPIKTEPIHPQPRQIIINNENQ